MTDRPRKKRNRAYRCQASVMRCAESDDYSSYWQSGPCSERASRQVRGVRMCGPCAERALSEPMIGL